MREQALKNMMAIIKIEGARGTHKKYIFPDVKRICVGEGWVNVFFKGREVLQTINYDSDEWADIRYEEVSKIELIHRSLTIELEETDELIVAKWFRDGELLEDMSSGGYKKASGYTLLYALQDFMKQGFEVVL